MTRHGNTSSRPPVDRARRTPSTIPRVYDDDESPGFEPTTTEQRPIAPRSVRSPKWAGLLTVSGDSAGRVHRLTRARTTLGRSRDCDIALTDHGVSRHHCTLSTDGRATYVEDAGSTNGTFVNGERVRSAQLAPGDRVQLGPDAVLQLGWFDETEEQLANRLVEAARQDVLTGALNRRAFHERFSAELAYAMRHREKLVALAFDIDHFKVVNDTYGHPAGDAVLRALAGLIATKLRAEDVFARVGGEEFVVVARGLSCENGVRLAERLRSAAEGLVVEDSGNTLRVTVSIGVAELGETGETPTGDALLELVDARLYEAKRRGRNRIVHA